MYYIYTHLLVHYVMRIRVVFFSLSTAKTLFHAESARPAGKKWGIRR